MLKANLQIIKALLEAWGGRLRARRVALLTMLRSSKQQYRLTAIHILHALMANGLAYHDDPAHTPIVRGRGGEMVSYQPVTAGSMALALKEAMVDRYRMKDASKDGLPRKRIYEPAARALGLLMKQAKDVRIA